MTVYCHDRRSVKPWWDDIPPYHKNDYYTPGRVLDEWEKLIDLPFSLYSGYNETLCQLRSNILSILKDTVWTKKNEQRGRLVERLWTMLTVGYHRKSEEEINVVVDRILAWNVVNPIPFVHRFRLETVDEHYITAADQQLLRECREIAYEQARAYLAKEDAARNAIVTAKADKQLRQARQICPFSIGCKNPQCNKVHPPDYRGACQSCQYYTHWRCRRMHWKTKSCDYTDVTAAEQAMQQYGAARLQAHNKIKRGFYQLRPCQIEANKADES